MNRIIIKDLPLPPSANELYSPNVIRYKDKSGKLRSRVNGYRKGEKLTFYQEQIEVYKKQKSIQLQAAKLQCEMWIKAGYMLKVDCYFALDWDRVWWNKSLKPKQIDANNFVKACLDGVAKLIDIDDKYFFNDEIEKVTTNGKEFECTIVRISPIKPKTLLELKTTMGIL